MTNSRSGYTLVELLLFLAITAVVAAAFAGILVLVVQLQAHQSTAGEVQEQSTALLQQIQYYVENAALVNIPVDTPTSTLSLRMPSSAQDPVTITLSNGIVYVQQGASSSQPLTSSRVVVSGLSFTRHANPSSHDSVNIAFTASVNTQNAAQAVTQAFQTTVTEVSAASFDSNVVPSSTLLNLGVSGSAWNSVNQVIYFSGSNVGIGTASPQASLDVSGGNIFVDTIGRGLKLRDSGGGCWLVTPNASGTLVTASISCSAP